MRPSCISISVMGSWLLLSEFSQNLLKKDPQCLFDTFLDLSIIFSLVLGLGFLSVSVLGFGIWGFLFCLQQLGDQTKGYF